MNDIVVLEWKFSPPDYFEEVIHIDRETYSIIIENGRIEARIDPTAYDQEHKMRDELHEALNDRFLGVQLLTHKQYELSKASMHRQYPDGRKEVTIFPEPIVMTMTVGSPDIIVKNKDGNIIADTRRDRIEKKKELAELAEKYRSKDQVVGSILKSYKSAVTDPENELVHLYEIRDALSSRFAGEGAARTTLGISNSNWSRLGKLANDEPLRQGRHRGKKVGGLRDATESELKEARGIARNMIEAYLQYLEDENVE
jgi:hypothetical protein